ncbi:hypothetical protein OL548_17450 [Lysinibacillus sp. MHQ-1]|nr:hypothetical protein OL548_17450 [Lysinibacillus sp. MHQ-1]
MLRQQNTELLIELSKYTSLSRESLTGPLKSMIKKYARAGGWHKGNSYTHQTPNQSRY